MRQILVSQSGHKTAWGVSPGRFIGVDRQKQTFIDYGTSLHVSVLAKRETAIRVAKHHSLGEAVEKYHDPSSRDFQKIVEAKRLGKKYVYHGCEFLFYSHDQGELMSFLICGELSKNFTTIMEKATIASLSRSNAIPTWKLSTTTRVFGSLFGPSIQQTDFAWNPKNNWSEAAKEFANPGLDATAQRYVTAAAILFRQYVEGSKTGSEARNRVRAAFVEALDKEFGVEA